MSLQMSECDRSVIRDTMLNIFESTKKLGKEVEAVAVEGRRALEQEKMNAFLVEEILGRLQVCGCAVGQRPLLVLLTRLADGCLSLIFCFDLSCEISLSPPPPPPPRVPDLQIRAPARTRRTHH